MTEFAPHIASQWMGHSVRIATAHYWQVTESDFAKATDGATDGTQKGAAKSEARASKAALHNPKQHEAAQTANNGKSSTIPAQNGATLPNGTYPIRLIPTPLVGSEGLEPPTLSV